MLVYSGVLRVTSRIGGLSGGGDVLGIVESSFCISWCRIVRLNQGTCMAGAMSENRTLLSCLENKCVANYTYNALR